MSQPRGFVIGRLFWDADHPSPWATFRNVTEYRRWARDVRKVRPRTKTEYQLLETCGWNAERLLARASVAD